MTELLVKIVPLIDILQGPKGSSPNFVIIDVFRTLKSNCPESEKGVLKNFAIFARKHLSWKLFLKRASNAGVFL